MSLPDPAAAGRLPAAQPGGGETAASPHFPVVGLGASAGGVAALAHFFERMPAQTGMAYVVVLHLSPDYASSAAAILQRSTPLPVIEVKQSTEILRDHVYVISPARSLWMSDGRLLVNDAERARGRPTAIDVFFRTLADTHRELAFGLVLSGTGSDGSLGLTRIKEQGGVTLVQTPEDAEFDGMPRSAIATGMADFVLPVREMAAKLVALWRNIQRIVLPPAVWASSELEGDAQPPEAAAAEAALQGVIALLRARTGHDLQHEKRSTLLRRLERRLQVCELPDLPAYRAHLESEPAELQQLLKDLLVGNTRFFRDHAAFESLERAVGASFLNGMPGRSQLRAWVVGCASGEEAYSVAMLLHEQMRALPRPMPVQVLASDIDERALAVARNACYPASIAEDVVPRRLRQFFSLDNELYRVNKPMRDEIVFVLHDVLRDPPFSRIDLVCCRNVLIYLEREAQAQVLKLLNFALQPDGLLFLGSAESAEAADDLFTPVDKRHRIYRARDVRVLAQQVPALPLLPPPEFDEPPQPPRLAQLHRRLVEQHAPATVLVDGEANILHLSPGATRYVRYAGGAPSHNLIVAIHDELRLALRTALTLASREGRSVEARQAQLQHGGRPVRLNMTVHPTRDEASGAPYMLVQFAEVEASLAHAAGPASGSRDAVEAELETELERTRESLHNSLGASRISGEELRASNEELQAINEELRAATEELQTSKEELQSVNEELLMVNQELKDRVDETGKVNDDLMNLIASSEIASVFVDRGLRITRFTPRAADVFSLSETDIGRPLPEVPRRLDYAALEADANQALRSLQMSERELSAPDGKSWRVRVLPYRTQEHRIDGAVLTFFDISATRQAEAQLHMRLAAESTRDYSGPLKDEFLAVMSQELKHPLNLIHVNAELISHLPEAHRLPAIARATEVIRRTVMSQAKMIDDLLDLSRLNSGQLALSRLPVDRVDWAAVIERVCAAVQAEVSARRMSLTRTLDHAAAWVLADALRVEQIVWNLLSNALKFTPDGGSVRLALRVDGGRSRLDVSDSGQGIEAPFLPHVFEMFRQADSRSTRQAGGLGIGLALVRQLSEAMGGAVAAESAGPGEGARFSVWLPRAGMDQPATTNGSGPAAG